MPFEITIEGSFADISQLKRNLYSFSPLIKKIPGLNENRERGRITILESREEHIDSKLLDISRTVNEAKSSLSLRSVFHIRVRNLAYSEPSSGSSQFMEPFSPIPSITIQPWTPDLAQPTDPRTIILDPHHAFGTGKHPTTLLCLRFMDLLANDTPRAQCLKGAKVLDFGCGTGLLAIAAVKMGAQEAVGVEIDPPSVRAAKTNVDLNHFSGRVTIREGSWEVVHEKYDFIFANLVITALLRTGKHIRDHLTPTGTSVVSGFGENQAEDVKRFFEEAGLTISKQSVLEGWGSASFVYCNR